MKEHRKNGIKSGRNWKVKNKSGALLHGDLTEKVIGLCYNIHYQYGSNQKESVYQKALEEKLAINGISFKEQVPISITSADTGKILGSNLLDLVIDDKVIVEIKALKFIPRKLEQQLYSYLKNSSYKVGLMINFGSGKLYIKRVILTHPPA